MYLIDTNVVSEARKKDRANAGVTSFFSRVAAEEAALAIALVNDLTVVTRNTSDYAGTGVRLENPFT